MGTGKRFLIGLPGRLYIGNRKVGADTSAMGAINRPLWIRVLYTLKGRGGEAGLGDYVVARFGGELASAIQVDVEELAVALHGPPGDEDRVDVAGVGTRYYGSDGVIEREDVQAVGTQHDDVGLFTRGERSGFMV